MKEDTEPNNAHQNGDEVTRGVKSTRTIKLRVLDIEWLQTEACAGESPAATLTRLHEEFLAFRAKCGNFETAVTLLREENDALQDRIDNFGSQTAVTAPVQTVIDEFGGAAVKDAATAISDVCDDESACVKTALHLIDKQMEVVGRQLDRDHARDEKAKDREHQEALETSRADHKVKLALIGKGVVSKSDLEDVVFLGSMGRRKTPGEQLADSKRRAYHAANDDGDDGFVDPADCNRPEDYND